MTQIKLSKRLALIASFFTENDIVTDIGADHGYLAMFLSQKFANKAYATEFGVGPFSKLIDNVEMNEFQNDVECYQANGLNGLRDDSNALIIAGMGGKTILDILSRRPNSLKNINKMVVEPQSESFLVRDFLLSNGYLIEEDLYVVEKGKAYPIIVAKRGVEEVPYEDYELEYGRLPLKKKDEILLSYIHKTINILGPIEDRGCLNEKSKVELDLARKAISSIEN